LHQRSGAAFQSLDAVFVCGRNPHKVADELSMPTKDPIVLFHRS
jgi:hypothetical protein